MATAKKKPAKKPVSNKSRTKSSPVKRSSGAKSVAAVSRSDRAFMETRFTEQTLYWLIIGVAVVALAAWVLSIQVQMNDMYDKLDVQNSETVLPAKKTVTP
ncbi:MAG: hypothetical protein WBB39_04735 [Candidatus Saccharimonadales bacterium]